MPAADRTIAAKTPPARARAAKTALAPVAPETTTAQRLRISNEVHRQRLQRRRQWIEFVGSFVPTEGQHPDGPDFEKLECHASVRDALHRALLAACDAIEAEAERDTRRSRRRER